MGNRTIIILGAVLMVGILFIAFGGPRVQLFLAQRTGVARPEVSRVIPAGEGVILVEYIRLQRGEVTRISHLSVDGDLRSRLFANERGVRGVTGDLVWTSAIDKPSLRLPDLKDGPRQSELVAACGLQAVSVHVAHAALQVLTPDGRTLYCRPGASRAEETPPSTTHSDRTRTRSPLGLDSEEGGPVRALRAGATVVAERLLDPRVVDLEAELGEDVVIMARESLADGSAWMLSRYGVDGLKWSQRLGGVGDHPAIASSGGQILVAGAGRDRKATALAIGVERGELRWRRDLDP